MVRYNNINIVTNNIKQYFLLFYILSKFFYKPYHFFQNFLCLFFIKFKWRQRFGRTSNFLNLYPPHRGLLYKIDLKPIWFFKKQQLFRKRKRLSKIKTKKNLKLKRLNLNFFKYYHLNQKYINMKYTNFSILQRIFLSKKNIKNRLWQFFYAPTKFYKIKASIVSKTKDVSRIQSFSFDKINKLTMLNANKPLISKMRKARYAHWDLRLKGRLNEWRYNKLLGVDLSYITKTNYYTFLSLILVRCFNFILSWRQILKLHNFNLVLHNGFFMGYKPVLKKGDIIELPVFIKNLTTKNEKYFKLITKKSKKRAYIEFLHSKKKLKKNNKNFPKIFKKLPVGFLNFGAFLDFDSSTNSFAIIADVGNYSHNVHYNILYTSVLTLQNWRYRFD